MKKLRTSLLTIATLLCSIAASAHDFEVDGIYYNITSSEDLTVEVTSEYYHEYTGEVVIPESVIYNGYTYSVTSIGESAFYDCSSLTSITIPNSVTSIGESAFSKCSGLTSITIPNSIISIGSHAFYGTRWWENQPDGLVYLDCYLLGYKGDKPNGEIIIKDGTKIIGNSAFSYCSGLTSITIPNSVISIGQSTFGGCSGLTSITIGNSVTSIGEGAFGGCSGLTSVTIPNSVTSIGKRAFDGCSGLTSVTIGNSLTSIGERTFSECSGLTSVTIGNSVTSIGESAFAACYSLTSVTIPNSVTSIGNNAFAGCSNINTLIIGTGVTFIGSKQNTTPSKTIWLTNTPPAGYYNLSGKINYVANEQYTSLSNKQVYPYLSSMFEVDGITYVPVNMTERTCDAIDIRHDASMENTVIDSTVSFKGVTMKVKKVMPYIGYNNEYIKSVTVSNQGNIGNRAFCLCVNLQKVTLDKNVTAIDGFAFLRCSSLPEIIIPQSVTTIGSYAFDDCTALTDVIIEDRAETLSFEASPFTKCPLDSVYIGGKITYDTSSEKGYSPFYRNTSLRAVTISDVEETIYDNEFYGCTNLKSVTIGNGVKSIGNWAFSGCSSLEQFSFGNKVESIGQEAFSDCTGLTELISHAVVPPVCGAQALEDINKWNCTLKVPESYKSAYQAADQWKDFFFIEDVVSSIDKILLDETTTADIYTIDGRLYMKNADIKEVNLPRGLYIIGGKKVMVK